MKCQCQEICKVFGTACDGNIGVLIKAKQEGYIDELKPVLYQMIEKGIYISSGLVQMCLKQVGET